MRAAWWLISPFWKGHVQHDKKLKFRKCIKEFQKNMKDALSIWISDQVIIKADQTDSYYNMRMNDYKRGLERWGDKKLQKKCPTEWEDSINMKGKIIVDIWGIEDKIVTMTKQHS